MSKTALLALFILTLSVVKGQDGPTRLTGNVVHSLGYANTQLAYSNLNKYDTKWSQLPGYGFGAGAGFAIVINDSWEGTADFGIESNTFLYDRGNIRLKLGYSVYHANLRIGKLFQKKGSTHNFWLVRAGALYHLVSGQSKEDNQGNFSYNMKLAEKGVISIMPEIGIHSYLAGKSSLQFTIFANYGLNTLLTTTLHAPPELNSAIATTDGNYLGFSIRYLFGFTSFGGRKGSDTGGSQIRKEI